MKLDELERKIKIHTSLNLLDILAAGNIERFYHDLLEDRGFVINIDRCEPSRDNEKLVSLLVAGTTSAFGFDGLKIELLFEEEYEELKSSLTVDLLENKLAFPNFSRFSIGDVEISIQVSDALVLTSCTRCKIASEVG